MYSDSLNVSKNALGTLQQQQDIYMESTTAHLQQMSTATERLMDAFIDNKGINSLIDGLTSAIRLLGNLVESIGGGGNALLMLGSIGAQVFSNQIANGLGVSIRNLERTKLAANEAKSAIESLETSAKIEVLAKDESSSKALSMAQRLAKSLSAMGQEEINTVTDLINKYTELINKKAEVATEVQNVTEDLAKLQGMGGISTEEAKKLTDPVDRNVIASKALNRAKAFNIGSEGLTEEEKGYDQEFFNIDHEEVIRGIDEIVDAAEAAYNEYLEIYQKDAFKGKGAEMTRVISNVEKEMQSLIDTTKAFTSTFHEALDPAEAKQLEELSDKLSESMKNGSHIYKRTSSKGKDIRAIDKNV